MDPELRGLLTAQAAALDRVAEGLVLLSAELRGYTAQVQELIAPTGAGSVGDPLAVWLAAAREAARDEVRSAGALAGSGSAPSSPRPSGRGSE